ELLQAALDTGGVEVFGLGQVVDPARAHQGREQPVREGEVVTGEDGGAVGGDVLHAFYRRPVVDVDERADQHVLQQPVEHDVLTPGSGIVGGHLSVADFTAGRRSHPSAEANLTT